MSHILCLGGTPIFQVGLLHSLSSLLPEYRISTQLEAAGLPCCTILITQRDKANQLLARLRKLDGPVLVVGPEPRLPLLRRLLNRGNTGYILKGTTPENLKDALITLQGGQPYLDPRLGQQLLQRRLGIQPGSATLTKREKEILHLIVAEHTTGEIAGKLFISSCTVETHRSNILGKLGVRNTAGLVREAIRQGLCAV